MSISHDVNRLRNLGWTWTRIGAHYRVSEREVRRWSEHAEDAPKGLLPPLVLSYATVLVVNDAQYPHHDPALWEVTCQLAQDVEPEQIVWAGDMIDFPQLSSFKFDPHKTGKAKEDVEGFHVELREPLLNAAAKGVGYKPDEIWLDGNHEHRYTRYMEENSNALEEADPVRFLELQDVDKYYPYGTRIGHKIVPELAVVHGWRVTKSALKEHVLAMDCSVIHGHTHRISQYRTTTAARDLAGFEVGHMSDYRKVPGHHGKGKPDWQQVAGTVVRHSRQGESFNVEVAEVFGRNNDRVIFGDREYRLDR